MFAQKGIELLQELKRTEKLGEYNEAGVRASIEEIHALYDEIKEVLTTTQPEERKSTSITTNLMVHHSAILRNKRVILAYLFERLERLKKIRWNFGSSLPKEIDSFLSSQEQDFFSRYDQLLNNYFMSVGLDLSQDLQVPPKDLYVEVRVIKEGGNLLTEKGMIDLSPGSCHFLPRVTVEPLVRQGILVHLPR